MAAAWSLILIGIMSGQKTKAILEYTTILQKIGIISYEIYLIHFLVLNVVGKMTSSLIVKGIVTVAISFVLAILVNRLLQMFEKKVDLHRRLAIILAAFLVICFSTGIAHAEKKEEWLYVPTMITKANGDYFIVDCWHHRVIYSDTLTRSLSEWKQLTNDGYIGGHTVSTDGELLVLDNTDQSQVLVYKKQTRGAMSSNRFLRIFREGLISPCTMKSNVSSM